MSDHDRSLLEEAQRKHEESTNRLEELRARITSAAENPDAVDADELAFLKSSFDQEEKRNKMWADAVTRTKVTLDARAAMKPQETDNGKADPSPKIEVKEQLVYQRGGEHSFFRDLRAAAGSTPDPAAQERLQRHASQMRVEMRDINSTANTGGEFVPPLYLQDQWIPLLRAKRPTADAVTNLPLQAGTMSYNLPKLTGGGATAIQASENAGVQETDPTTNIVTATVKTVAGQIDVSRQLFEFSNPGIDEILFRDLASDYATKLDVQVLSGSGSSGQALGIRNVSGINSIAAGSTATAVALWPKISSAISSITSAFMTADTIVMHPRRVAFWAAALDGSNRPFFNAISPYNAMGNLDQAQANGAAGNIQGLRIVADPSIPTNVGTNTNEDVMIVFDSSQLYLWEEGAPRTRVFEDVGSGTLTVRLSCYGFFAFMGNRLPAAISVVSGSALAPPTF